MNYGKTHNLKKKDLNYDPSNAYGSCYEEARIPEDTPFIFIGTTSNMGKEAAIELIRGCEQFKEYYKQLFGFELNPL